MIEICSDAESSDNDGDDDVKLTKVVIDEGQKWDCESILSKLNNVCEAYIVYVSIFYGAMCCI